MTEDTFNKRWEEFEKRCRSCNSCGLRKDAKNVVIYRGSRRAPLMIIGEGPGKEEDEKGLPFVGQSGKLLQTLLGIYGFKPKDYHICNIVKCHPPENRRPEAYEIKACKKHLAEQFELVKPRVVLLCGSTAYEAFFGVKPVMHDVRGFFIERNGFYIMTTFHPAYALRNEKGKIPLYEDMGKVRKKLEELGAV
ncbi:MAG: uracil-DNA glycosylase [Clostridiales bacterium]|nr:uracil-DNA glycosylase [Clostridiales bacterium]